MKLKGKRILIVDDEEDLCEILQYNLNNEGYDTETAHSAEEALKKPITSFDLLILDVMMGQMSGYKLADVIRKDMNSNVPVIFLTAKGTENDILTGFSVGADDYLTKPFSINELTARVKAVLKRFVQDKQNKEERNLSVAKFGEIEIDTARKRAIIGNEKIELTKKEYDILKLLLENPARVFSRDDILRLIWGANIIVTDRTVDVNITRLRTKLGKFGQNIKNKTGFGYFFEL